MTFELNIPQLLDSIPTTLTLAVGIMSIVSGSSFALRALHILQRDWVFRRSYHRSSGISDAEYERDMYVREINRLTIKQHLLNYVVISIVFVIFGLTIVGIGFTYSHGIDANYFGIISFVAGIVAVGNSVYSTHSLNRAKSAELELQIKRIEEQLQTLRRDKGGK